MKQRNRLIILLIMWTVTIIPVIINVRGCSHFTASHGNAILVANNKDTEHQNSHIWCYPSSEGKFGRILFGVIEGVPNGWTYVQCGLNDQGLFIDGADVPLSVLKNHSEKPQFSGEQVRPFVLEKCATVNDTIELLSQYQFETRWHKQYLVADKYGEAMLVSAGNDHELSFTRKQGIYLHGTNFNINDPFPCWRYDTAKQMLDEIEGEENITIEYFKQILSSINQSFTVYSNIYDIQNGNIYIYRNRNFNEVAIVNLTEELAKGEYNCSLESLMKGKCTFPTTTQLSTTKMNSTTAPSNTETDTSDTVSIHVVPILGLLIISLIIHKKRK